MQQQTLNKPPSLGDWVAVQHPWPYRNWRGIVVGVDRASGVLAIAVLVRPRNCSRWDFSVVDFEANDVALLQR